MTKEFLEPVENYFCDENGKPLFTCSDCGGHDLIVVVEGYLITEEIYSQPCKCSIFPNEEAGRIIITTKTPFIECFYLDGEHRFRDNPANDHPFCEESLEKEEEIEEEIFCSNCFDPEKEGKLIEQKENEEEEYRVLCEKCGREIEFGWSHPDRAGRIWPVEARDFNPWLTWPEPRYRKKWLERGWVNPKFFTDEDIEFLKTLDKVPEIYKGKLPEEIEKKLFET